MSKALHPLNVPLLFLFAMGSWGNTPSPPLDANAPDPVGNDGELVVEIDGERTTHLVQSARLASGSLTIEGEKVEGESQFTLILDLPQEIFDGAALNTQALRQATLLVRPGSRVLDLSGDERAVSAGKVRLTRANGSGPWEVDGEVELRTDRGVVSGTLEARVTA